jgi:hypothetical protein
VHCTDFAQEHRAIYSHPSGTNKAFCPNGSRCEHVFDPAHREAMHHIGLPDWMLECTAAGCSDTSMRHRRRFFHSATE